MTDSQSLASTRVDLSEVELPSSTAELYPVPSVNLGHASACSVPDGTLWQSACAKSTWLKANAPQICGRLTHRLVGSIARP
jgi:hypothetical protein